VIPADAVSSINYTLTPVKGTNMGTIEISFNPIDSRKEIEQAFDTLTLRCQDFIQKHIDQSMSRKNMEEER